MRFERFPAFEKDPLGADELDRLQEKLETWASLRATTKEYPEVYPEEKEAVSGFFRELRSLLEKKRDYAAFLLRIAKAYKEKGAEGVEEFIYVNLAKLISEITSGSVENFDEYRECENGDSALALLGRYVATLELVEKSTPKLKREIFYPSGEDSEKTIEKKGAILFICGYGATFEPYKGIFSQFNLPVVAYQLPHGVIGENPESVDKTFDEVHEEILKDPLLDKVTHVIGTSIGTMFASRVAADVCDRDPERNIQVALIQVGTSYQGALENTNAKFGRELRERLKKRGLSLADFQEATKNYNPIELADKLSGFVSKGKLDLSLFIGLGDKMITPARPLVDPLLKKFDSGKASGKYNAYISEVAGHNSSVLFFLWLARQKATEWAHVLKGFYPESDFIQTPRRLAHHHVRRTT